MTPNCRGGEGRHPWEDHTYPRKMLLHASLVWADAQGGLWRGVCWEITVDGDLAYPVAPHPRCVEDGTYQGSCSEGVIDSDVHGLLDGPGDALGLPVEKLSSLMECPVVWEWSKMGEGPQDAPLPVQNSYQFPMYVLLYIPGGHTSTYR